MKELTWRDRSAKLRAGETLACYNQDYWLEDNRVMGSLEVFSNLTGHSFITRPISFSETKNMLKHQLTI